MTIFNNQTHLLNAHLTMSHNSSHLGTPQRVYDRYVTIKRLETFIRVLARSISGLSLGNNYFIRTPSHRVPQNNFR